MAPRKPRPTGVSVIAYDVGFGDCFLLRVTYAGEERARHVLIDFGSFPRPRWAGSDYMVRVAEAIREDCGERLDAVVATHRHADHVNGFARRDDGSGSGDLIRGLKPSVVVQPWTEHPDAAPDATGALPFVRTEEGAALTRGFTAALGSMHALARTALDEAAALREHRSRIAAELAFLGGDNLPNRSAVENLMTMAKDAGGEQRYVHFGAASGLEAVLPGVKVRVLGPPTVEQTDTILKQRSTHADEFWHLHQAFWGVQAAASGRRAAGTPLFPGAATMQAAQAPAYARWLIEKLHARRGRELLEIVRALDTAMNNTSVILLFEVAGRKLLFPGDAQIENWSYALSQPGIPELLADVDLYKVGHHGSLNATPRASLWPLFIRRSADPTPRRRRLRTLLSTEGGHHGSTQRQTEVPRGTLVDALNAESDLFSTDLKFESERTLARTRDNPVRRLEVKVR